MSGPVYYVGPRRLPAVWEVCGDCGGDGCEGCAWLRVVAEPDWARLSLADVRELEAALARVREQLVERDVLARWAS